MNNASKMFKQLYDESSELHDKLEKQINHNRIYLKDIVSGSNS